MTSNTLPVYKKWLKTATPEQIVIVDRVYTLCEEHYGAGGDTIVECYSPTEILDLYTQYDTVDELVAGIRDLCGIHIEQALNARWGEDSDPEVARAERHREWV